MAKQPNYGFLKHQKDIKRKKKQEEKRLRRLNKANAQPEAGPQTPEAGNNP